MVQNVNEKQDFNPSTAPPGYTDARGTIDVDDTDTSSDSSFSDIEAPPRSTASPPPDSREATPMAPPSIPVSNYLEISKDYQPISGRWRIDTALFIPPAMLFPLEEGEQRYNLSLTTQVGPINADVELVRGEEDGRALLKFVTNAGPITLRLTAPNHQKALINCTANAGPIRINIPRSFRGPVTIKERYNMSSNFSSEVTANSITFYQRNGETKCFIGELAGSGFGDENEDGSIIWDGDEIIAESQSGGVIIGYEDEAAPGPGRRGHGRHNHGQGFGWWGPMPPPPPLPPTVPDFGFTGFPFGHHHHHGQQWPFELFGMIGGDHHRGGRGGGRGRGGRGGFHFGFGGHGGHGTWTHHHHHEHDDHHHHGGEGDGEEGRERRREERDARREERRRHRHEHREYHHHRSHSGRRHRRRDQGALPTDADADMA